MDLSKFELVETKVVHVRDGNDDLMFGDDNEPMTWTVFGPGTKAFARAEAARQNRAVERYRRKGKVDMTAEQRSEDTCEFLVGVTKEISPNWKNGDLQGEALWKSILLNRKLVFIPEQLDTEVRNSSGFSKPSTKTSDSTSGSGPG